MAGGTAPRRVRLDTAPGTCRLAARSDLVFRRRSDGPAREPAACGAIGQVRGGSADHGTGNPRLRISAAVPASRPRNAR
jgi:hypothetical protein